MKGKKGKSLQRRRSEVVERTFAHVLETGGARRTWLRGIGNVRKRYSIATAAHNLGIMMRVLFGIGTARSLQAFCRGLKGLFGSCYIAWVAIIAIMRLPDDRRLHNPYVLNRNLFELI